MFNSEYTEGRILSEFEKASTYNGLEKIINNNGSKKKFPNLEDFDSLQEYYKEPYNSVETKKEKEDVVSEFRKNAANILISKYEWPKPIAKLVSNFSYPVRGDIIQKEKFTDKVLRKTAKHLPDYASQKVNNFVDSMRPERKWSDYLLAITTGFLPERYVIPIAKLMKVPRRFITKNSIRYDYFSTGITLTLLYIIPEAKEVVDSVIPSISGTTGFLNDASTELLKWNIYIKAFQWPHRTYNHIKNDEHTAGLSSVVNPNPFEAIPAGMLFGYDWFKKAKHLVRGERHDSFRNGIKKTQQIL